MDRSELVQLAQELVIPLLVGSGGLIAWVRRWRQKRRIRRRLEAAELEAVRVLVNVLRYQLWLMHNPSPSAAETRKREDHVATHRFELDEAREGLWLALGNRTKRLGADLGE